MLCVSGMDWKHRIMELCGPFITPRLDSIYGSYHFNRLSLPGNRHTLHRFERFSIPAVITGTVLDLGSQCGAMSLEWARRGAIVHGVEFDKQRVDLCNRLARFLNVNARFYHTDLNSYHPQQSYDVLTAFAIDAYVKDVEIFRIATEANVKIVYFEANNQKFDWTTLRQNFKFINYLGTSGPPAEPDAQFIRRLYVMSNCVSNPIMFLA